MSIKKALIIAATAAVSLLSAAGWASAACALSEEVAIGKKVAAAVRSEIKVEGQSKRLIKFYSCEVVDGATYVTFTYNYVADGDAYAVDGSATLTADGVAVQGLNAPSKVWASIDTYYEEVR